MSEEEFPSGTGAGSIMVLQQVVASILQTHPNRDAILETADVVKVNLEAMQAEAASNGDAERFMFLSEASAGAKDTLDALRIMS